MQPLTCEATLEEILGESPDLPVNIKQRAIEAPAGHGEFLRIEDEALLSRKQADLLLDEVNRRMEPSYQQKGTVFTLMESHYFDSPELAFFRQHFLQAPKRYKLRINRCAPNGAWNCEAPVIELKTYKKGVSKKRRFALACENYERVLSGQTLQLTDDLLALNQATDREDLLCWLMLINGLIAEYRLKPALKLRYKRLSFKEAGSFRLSVDTDLMIETLDLDINGVARTRAVAGKIWEQAEKVAAKYKSGHRCVVKFKHAGRLPPWAEAFMRQHGIERTCFSKYCWAVNETAGPGTSLPEVLDGRILSSGAC